MPNRILRAEALTSRRLGAVSAEAEALYYRLLLVADDYGRYWAEPALVQAATYPRGERQVAEALEELFAVGLLVRYEVDGEPYLAFARWLQRADRRSSSKFPDPPREVAGIRGNPRESAGNSRDSRETAGNRGKPREVAGKSRLDGDGDVDEDVDGDEDEIERAFARFWSIYPRRVGKRAARAKFALALRRATLDEILAGAERYRDDPARDPKYTKHPATWLNQDCWLDEPLDAGGETPAFRPEDMA